MADESKGGVEIDEDFYSRQLLVLGREAMERMGRYSVLISGMSGLGCEVAKNVILAGMQSVTLHDDDPVALADLSSHFYLKESDVGAPRAAACVGRLRALNSMVRVEHVTGELSEAVLSRFNMVVMVNQPLKALEHVGAICAARKIHMVATGNPGLFGYTFTALGKGHVIIDENGEDPASGVAVSITKANPGVVQLSTKDGDKHGLADGDVVVFERVEGMVDLNGGKGRPVKVINASSFSIEDTSGYGDYVRGGYFKQVKQPVNVDYKSFAESLAEPELVADWAQMERPANLLALLRALWQFQAANGRLPAPGKLEDAKAVTAAAAKLAGKEDFGDDSATIDMLAAVSSGNINPLAAVFGGITAQEVIKAASGKYTPIKQWFMLDSAPCLEATPTDTAPVGSRYDGQVAVFGKEFQKKLLGLNYFLVGSGALGCEFLKNFALMGVGAGEGGSVYVTDMDNIEKSNLNRQFLFHEEDVGKMKSIVAAREAKSFNPDFNVIAAADKMAPDTESKYNDAFWLGLDGVCNALDNLDARLYIDSRCVNFLKPLLESGTLGTMGNNLTCIPNVTLNYGAGPRPTEHKFPVCVVHGFPHNIQHCLHWAKEHFDNLFKDRPTEVNSYLTTPDFLAYLAKQKGSRMQRLQVLCDMLAEDKRPRNFADCVRFARLQFQEWYNIAIKNLLHQHPLDEVIDGVAYWSEKKRPPTPEDFTLTDDLHVAFMVSCACLHARLFGIPESGNLAEYEAALEGFDVPEFDETRATFVPANDEERKKYEEEQAKKAEEEAEDLNTRCERLASSLPSVEVLGDGFACTPINFEKDDSANKHMDFIYAAANLRARQYNIPESDMMAARKFVGDIIPAIATTTAICTGLVALELIKLVGNRPKEAFYNNNFNLAVNTFNKFEVDECKAIEIGEHKFTLWNKLSMPNDATVREVVNYFREKYGWVVVGIFSTGADPLSLWSGEEELDDDDDEDLDTKVSDLYRDLKEIDDELRNLVIELELGGDLEDVEDVPYVNIPLH